jgi:hypothetical protein
MSRFIEVAKKSQIPEGGGIGVAIEGGSLALGIPSTFRARSLSIPGSDEINRDLLASGSDIVQTAKRHLGERYVLGSVADYANPNFTGPWDCAEFASWCLYRVSQIHFGARAEGAGWSAHTGFWAEDARNAHATIRWQEAAIVAGAFLVRMPGAHPGVASGHIAICDGSNRTIEAMDSAHGVMEGKVRGRIWDLGVLVPGIDYSHCRQLRARVRKAFPGQ